ncbi:metallophosphoesterase family protein [Halolamina sp. CBA1230]|uniref:metallophosphoesterase family protein n=1 Tax=Halolamina sp. CBA1230 TaxID=1853690 RepID=UPI001C3D36AB|nr:metallophosphoesterase family protein [Halolamina sp. CBA1230]
MELAVVSDSHVPERESALPEEFRERIAAADHTIHAGDFQTVDVLDDVRALASELTAVHGNVDPDGIGLPAVDAVTLGGVTFVVTHDDQPRRRGRRRRRRLDGDGRERRG